jgi:hypothetical protein
MLTELGLPVDVLSSGEFDQPIEEEELAIKMEFGYKHNMAIDIEKKVDAVFTDGRIKEALTVIRDRLFDSGVAIFKAFTDLETGKVGFRVVNPNNFIVSPTLDPYFKDIWYAGEAVLMTIDEIRRECKASGVDVSEDQLESIAQKHIGNHGNKNSYSVGAIGSFAYDSVKIPVYDGEFLSCNKYWYEKRWDKRGNPVIGGVEGPSRKSDREYYSDTDIVVYRHKWIIDTDIMFNYGLKSDVYRKDSHIWDTRLSYLAVAPELNAMETNPMIEQMMPIVDQVVLAWYKLQNVIAKARPKGILIEIGALEDISLGEGGDESAAMSPLSILDMFTQTGVLVYRKLAPDGTASNYRPIEELKNGLGTEAAEYFAVIDKFMSYMAGLIGMNEVTDGSTPDPKLLNGVAGLAQEATSNALHHLLMAERYLIEVLADEIAVRVHDSMTFKKNSVYRNIVAPSNIKSLKQDEGPLHRIYGIAIEYDADSEEKINLQNMINLAIQSGQITIADSIAIKRVRNLKQAELLLAFRIQKNQEKQAALAQADKMGNAEASAIAARAAEEEKRKTFELEAMVKGTLVDKENQWKLVLLEREWELKGGVSSEQNEAKKTVAQTAADATRETALIKSKEKANAPKIV